MRRRSRSITLFLALAGLVGAAASYFFDSTNGRRRRHVTSDRSRSLGRRGAHRARRAIRHVTSDAAGTAKRLVHSLPHAAPELDDATLAHKVESILFRDRDVPKGQINVNAENGIVFLRGQVDEVGLLETLESRVRNVRGVRGVENLLHLPGSPPPDR